jgi:hypothetical protein
MSRPNAGLDVWDRCGAAPSDVLDAANDLLVSNKFRLSVASILSVFTMFTV